MSSYLISNMLKILLDLLFRNSHYKVLPCEEKFYQKILLLNSNKTKSFFSIEDKSFCYQFCLVLKTNTNKVQLQDQIHVFNFPKQYQSGDDGKNNAGYKLKNCSYMGRFTQDGDLLSFFPLKIRNNALHCQFTLQRRFFICLGSFRPYGFVTYLDKVYCTC